MRAHSRTAALERSGNRRVFLQPPRVGVRSRLAENRGLTTTADFARHASDTGLLGTAHHAP